MDKDFGERGYRGPRNGPGVLMGGVKNGFLGSLTSSIPLGYNHFSKTSPGIAMKINL